MKPSLLNISKAMAFATAIGAASAAWAYYPGSTDFENEAVPNPTYTEGSAEISQIDALDVASRPAHYDYANSRTNVLEIETSADSPVFRKLNANGTNEVGTIYVDMLVKPTAIFAPGASPNAGDYDKLLVYFKETSAGTTNLCVYAGYLDNETLIQGECILTTSQIVDKDTWYRLVIKAKLLQEAYPGFNVYLGGYGEDFICTSGGNADFYSLLVDVDNPVAAPSEVAKVGFAGSGFVDDFVASDIDPDAVVTVPFTLTWPSGVTAVSYTVDGGEPTTISGDSGMQISVPDGAVVAFTFQNADGATKTMSATASSSVNAIDATGATFGWAEYLGAAVDGAYQIDNLAELKLFQKGVAAGLVTSNETFKLTADVTLDAPWPGIGVQNGKDIYSTAAFDEAAFCGTFDGQNHTVSGFQMIGKGDNAEGLDYCGFFNSTYGATIQNFKIAYAGALFAADTTASTKESGATFVGVAKNSTLRNLTTVAGTVSCSKGFGGIVGYLTSGTTVDSCTNNVNMTSLANNKCGGIAMIAQGGSAVTITNCQNNGTQTTGSSNSEYGAIVGYVGVDITIADCETTVGRFLKHQGSTVTLQGVNKGDATVLAYHGAATPGLNFATVDGNVATFVADNALALNGEYKVMASGATATFEFTDLGTISFDEALSTPTYAITSSGAAGIPTSDKKGDVTTYTAGYFPRTATAGQDGTAEHPFEIADLDDLQALQAAVAADVGRDLCYVQTADIALTGAWEGIGVKGGKDIVTQATYDNGAFTGTYDGGNYTISNFQMESGTDYGALFNSVYNATIKNLKISYKENKLTPTADSNDDSTGATFVGVAKSSTLQNLTAVAGTVTTVSAYKDMGGIVGYLMAGSTVESCTNQLNVASTKGGRKCGGIAIITQGGSGTATIRNCKNSGTTAGGAQDGGIVGYIGTTTAIIGCENTANAPLLTCQSGTVTVSGGTKSVANRAAFVKNGGTVVGLNFATVDGNVATFVADNALAAGNIYKVMASGATATFAFAEAGTIAFDTALFTPAYAITAAEGLTLTDETVGTVKTYTAAAAAPSIPDWATDVTGESVIDQAVSEKYAAWAANVADGDTTGDRSAQFLMNVPVAAEVALTIDGIEVTSDGTIVTIGATKTIDGSTTPITLGTTDAGVDTPAINGILNVMVAADLGSWTKKAIPAANLVFVNGKAQVLIPATDGRFVKASVDYSTPSSSITAVTE